MIEGLELAPDEWLLAPWRPRTTLLRPPERKFSRSGAEKAFRRVARAWRTRLAWNESDITAAIGKEEALFWLHGALALNRYGKDAPERIEEPWNLADVPEKEATLSQLEGIFVAPSMLIVLDRLYGWPAAVELAERARCTGFYQLEYDDVFRRGLLPYLTEAELERTRTVVRARMTRTHCPGIVLALAGLIGVPEAVTAWLPRAMRGEVLERAAFFGLGSAEEVIAHRDWLKRASTEMDVVAWLANTGITQLEWLVDGMWRLTSSSAVPLVRAMAARVAAPEAAPHFLMLVEQNRGAKPALEWLLADPQRTLKGLDGHQWSKNKLGRRMLEAETALRRRLNAVPVQSAEEGSEYPGDLNRELEQASALRAKLPAWLSIETLPEIRVGEAALGNASLICAAFSTIRVDPLEDHPLASAIRRHGDPAMLDAFGLALFERWLQAGMPPKDRWALGAIGLLGGRQCAITVIPYLRRWSVNRHVVRKLGYQGLLWILRRIGHSPEILWGLRQTATEYTAAIEFFRMYAIDRGMSQEQLEDLILPKPTAETFDFGPRQLEVRIGENAMPFYLENNGVRHAKPPKPVRTDDPEKAVAAWEKLKAIDKELAQIRKFALKRIENASLSTGCWTKEDFEVVLLPHPIYAPLCRLVIWGCIDSEHNLIATFRVSEDRRYSGPDDRLFALPAETWRIGLPRPSAFCNAEGDRWRQVFDDYNLIPLLPQLTDRPLAGPVPDDFLDAQEILLSAPLCLVTLQQAMRSYAYSPTNGGAWSKMYAARIEARLVSDSLDSAHSVSLLSFRHRQGAPLTARDVDPVVIQEILSDLSKMQLQFETNS